MLGGISTLPHRGLVAQWSCPGAGMATGAGSCVCASFRAGRCTVAAFRHMSWILILVLVFSWPLHLVSENSPSFYDFSLSSVNDYIMPHKKNLPDDSTPHLPLSADQQPFCGATHLTVYESLASVAPIKSERGRWCSNLFGP
jgi:hypothetical protein